MARSESLFSLEVIVESVESICVSCLKPAVAFCLLDFPTVIIHSKPEEHCTNKASYQFQSGKSCLFKMRKDLLAERLRNMPLYIMLVDTSLDKTQLYASATISLIDCFEEILASIEKNGLDIPAVSANEGEFLMYNLMGSHVATVKLRYRMFSLGAGMTGHVDLSLSKQVTQTDGELSGIEVTSLSEQVKTENICLHKETVCEPIGQEKSLNPDLPNKNYVSQTDEVTQTDTTEPGELKNENNTPKSSRWTPRNSESFGIQNQFDVWRPPPLYYNSASKFSKTIKVSNSHSSKPKDRHRNTTRSKLQNSSASFTKDATKSVPSNNVNEAMISNPQFCDTSVQTCEVSCKKNEPAPHEEIGSTFGTNQVSLPLIEALLNELSLVKTQYVGALPCTSLVQEPGKVNGMTEKPTNNSQIKNSGIISSKKLTAQKDKTKTALEQQPRKSAIKSKPVKGTKVKSVLISRHPIKFKKTSLQYGTTKTQKLREAMNKKKLMPPDGSQFRCLPEITVESNRDRYLERQNPTSQVNVNAVGPQSCEVLKRESKWTMTDNGDAEKNLECKDFGVQVMMLSSDHSSNLKGIEPRLRQYSLLDNDLASNLPLSNNDEVNQDDPYLKTLQNTSALSSNIELFPNYEFPTYSTVSPTLPVSSNKRCSQSDRPSEDSLEESPVLLDDKSFEELSLGLVNQPVNVVLSQSSAASYSENFDSDASEQTKDSNASL